MDVPGTILSGRYELVSVAGSGGMATVWKAIQHGAAGFQREVCIKRIKETFSHDQAFRDMFVEEARVGSLLVHPHVVQVVDFGIDEGRYFLVMEWVDGVTLQRTQKLLTELGRLTPWPLVAVVAIECLRGLGAAHDHAAPDGTPTPVFHRDVTPQNILLGRNGITKLTDFGLARSMDRARITQPDMVKGKLGYLAPELLRGDPASVQTDLYALGVALWQALAGRPLFDSHTREDLLERARDPEIPPIDELRDDVPPILCQIIERALAPDPADRFVHADQMARIVANLLRELPERVEPKMVGRFVNGLQEYEGKGKPPGSQPAF